MNFLEYLRTNAGPLLDEAVAHARIVAISVAIALVVGAVLGVLAHRSKLLRPAILTTSATLLTIPSLALFALAIPLFGLGARPTVFALVLYALLPIVRNTVSGLAASTPRSCALPAAWAWARYAGSSASSCRSPGRCCSSADRAAPVFRGDVYDKYESQLKATDYQ